MGRVIVSSRKEMYLIAGIAASVKVAKMVTGKNRPQLQEVQKRLRHKRRLVESGGRIAVGDGTNL